MKILLIGASGQLGHELLATLPSFGSVVATLRPGTACRFESSQVEQRYVDLLNLDALRTLVERVRPELVINAAAYTAVDAAATHQAEAMAVNAVAPGALAEATASVGGALIHYSTDYVFDGGGERAWREDDPIAPVNFYGHSKAAGEAAIRAVEVPYLIVRTAWVYGVHGQNFVKKMLALGANRPELTVVADQFGTPTSARFLAEATCRILAQGMNDPRVLLTAKGGTLHVTCSGRTSWCGFAEEIFSQAVDLGLPVGRPRILPIPSEAFPTPARRPRNSQLDLGRLERRFGIVAPAWQDELRENLPPLFANAQAQTS